MKYRESVRFKRANEISALRSRQRTVINQIKSCSENDRAILQVGLEAIQARLRELGYQSTREEHILP